MAAIPRAQPTTVVGWLRERAARHPDRRSATYGFPDRPDATLTFGELERRTREFAALYARSGIGRGDLVVLLLEHSVDMMPAFHGAQWIGAVPTFLQVPTARMRFDLYARDLTILLERSKPRAILLDPELRESLAPVLPKEVRVLVPTDARPGELAGEPLATDPEDVCMVQYSSGSTGLRKGTALSDRAVLNELSSFAEHFRLGESDHVAAWLPLYHDWGLICVTVASVVLGCEYTLLSPAHWIGHPASIYRRISDRRATCYWMPNFAFNYSASRIPDSDLEGVDLSCLRAVTNGAEPCFHESHEKLLARFARYGLRREALAIVYGMAEVVCVVVSIGGVGNDPIVSDCIDRKVLLEEQRAVAVAEDHERAQRVLSVGRCLGGTRFRIVDPSTHADLPDRVVGEVLFQSNAQMNGYYRNPEASAACMRDGWYVTGDLAYRVGDLIFYTGRRKDLIILGGNNLYPQDVEEIVFSHPNVVVGRAVALGVTDLELGTQRLVVVCETRSEDAEGKRDVVRFVRREVAARIGAHVDRVYFAPPRWLLKTPSGKIARQPNLERLGELE
ncbi:MAG TPA: AMP-binding protein [Planctomycetota bacterium]|nr:AMP-binding protein [Planctomycetota bacterium]